MLVHLHIYYLDLLDEFIENLKNIPIPFDLYITLVEKPESEIKKIFEFFPNTKVFTVPNQRNDLGGFVEVINNVNLDHYDVVIKLHTKKSLHTGVEQKEWRQRLVKTLIGSEKQAVITLHNFIDDRTGMVGSHEDVCNHPYEDPTIFSNLCKRLEIEEMNLFFRGTIFAIRSKILKKIIEKNYLLKDFDPAISRGLPYAFERAFGSLCINQGYQIKTLDSVYNK
ncbi:MAG: hypothetical protein KGQ36_02345 [Rickettsiales bacterium]|nr:hypothetical protein [Rickettsiales bacterium]